MSVTAKTDNLLFNEAAWTFQDLQRAYDAIEDIGLNDLGLDTYANQIEVITSEQMLDAYSSHGMPLMYRHWSFGKHFARDQQSYQKGHSGLAYEIVINSDPCIAYLMEENSMTMQALVIAHACMGHNHFFKNNYLFRQWTDASSILTYLEFAKKYIAKCEDEYGFDEVESVLDAAHALMDQGVYRYNRPPKLSDSERVEKIRARAEHERETFNDLWRTLPNSEESEADQQERQMEVANIKLPEENLLYFVEKASPSLLPWQRELIRIVRNISQYFYPQKQTKVMNEGCATFVHHYIMNELHARGQISDGSVMEFLHSHSSVVFQPTFDDPRYSGINPYALGFAMMQDIVRIVETPEDEDREWFPDLAGRGDWRGALKDAWANYRDESFILQYLSPKLMRDFRFFALGDDGKKPYYQVTAIHNEQGYRQARNSLSRMYDLGLHEPNLQVVAADLSGDRKLVVQHTIYNGRKLDPATRGVVLGHLQTLWGYEVELTEAKAEDI
ncbi:SpoVR family protein [Parvularcula sp. LCG005]|uniref:SpoVR family protein n=1 Tax=Parvularcula sp. LCG005 TaxID=3078805 RepID=UPI0029421D8A|nr:SpoVR family protein [Parvularcula sp. LCG005]WOI52799.1 SpoVR family protein [Parvularcula sp. LCG005]